MIHIHAELPTRFPAARMLLQIHDELVFEAPAAEIPALESYVRDAMEHAMDLRVPLAVSSSHGPTWADD
jgi:DNA polymerase-1